MPMFDLTCEVGMETGESHDVGAILRGPDYFRCDRFRVTMKKAYCIEQQRIWESGDYNRRDGWKYEKCDKCEQGKESGMSAENSTQAQAQACVSASKAAAPAPVCKRCGEQPAMIRKDTGRVVNGYCGACNGAVRTENRLERLKSLEERENETIRAKETMSEESVTVTTKTVHNTGKSVISVDFTGREEMLMALQKQAGIDFRPVDLEILYLINVALLNIEY